jgi:hypothetical protein
LAPPNQEHAHFFISNYSLMHIAHYCLLSQRKQSTD